MSFANQRKGTGLVKQVVGQNGYVVNLNHKVIMGMKSNEPKPLHRGKGFHRKIQSEWHMSAEGDVKTEKSTTKPSGRKGRMDIFVKSDGSLAAVVEIKASNWDAMTVNAVYRNVRRQSRQIWDYIESQLGVGNDVSPGIIFPKRPRNSGCLNLIEKLFDKEGISVVWNDESIASRGGELRERRGDTC